MAVLTSKRKLHKVARTMVPLSNITPLNIEDVLSAIETARDKVMADEVKSLVKLGLPKSVATKMVADRYRQKIEGEESESETGPNWPDLS